MKETLEQKNSETDATHQKMQNIAANQKPADASVSRQDLLNTIAGKLVAAREARGEKIDQAVRKLKLSKSHLKALEKGNWELLPDQIYALGFLRQYCQYLELDLAEEITQLKNDQYALTKPLTFPDPPVAPSKRWAWLAGATFIILFILFNVLSNNDDSIDKSTNAIDTQQTDMATAEPANNDDETDTALPDSMQPVQAESATVKITHKPIVDLQTATPDAVKTGTLQSKKNRNSSTIHHYKFQAVTGAVWVQIFAPNKAGTGRGALLKEVLLQQGQYSTIKRAVESLWINCGNAPALRVKVDGKTVAETGALGGGKKVLRDYRFNINGQ